jgi:hypothetical protein
MKRYIVTALERACSTLRHPSRCLLANWSDRLDQRWNTHVWTTVDHVEHPDVPGRA